MRKINQQGSILIVIIVSMLFTAVLAVGIYSLTSTSTYGGLMSNTNDNAYQMAKAGIRYAIETGGAQEGEFHMPDKNMMFTLARSGDEITSTGIVNQGSIFEARRVLRYTLAGVAIVVDPRITEFVEENVIASYGDSIVSDGEKVELGQGKKDSYGAVWYSGDKANGNCVAGACDFGFGLHIYFEFSIPLIKDNKTGDGFTFAIMSSLNNTNNRTGGLSQEEYGGSFPREGTSEPSSVAGGELLGYSGPGNTRELGVGSDGAGKGEGLRPPKIALQFDTSKTDGYKPIYVAGSRNDPSFSNGHVSLMFWGDPSLTGNTLPLTYIKGPAGVTHTYPLSSFDDNRHEEGPAHRRNGLAGFSTTLKDGKKRFCRMEITRKLSPESSGSHPGKYKYDIKVWMGEVSTLTADPEERIRLQDVVLPYNDKDNKWIKTNAPAYFTHQEHEEFNRIYWGFTQGTGWDTQNITLENITAFLPNTPPGQCSYSISPAEATHPSTSGTGTVDVNAPDNCYWLVSGHDAYDWLTIVSPPYGRGNGKLNYSISENTGASRDGTIMIAGRPFNIRQEGSIAFDSYTIRNSTGYPIYRESGGYCSNSVNNNGTYTIDNNSPGVTFYSGSSFWFQTCIGNSINVTFEQAAQRDTNTNGIVQINQSWVLTDY